MYTKLPGTGCELNWTTAHKLREKKQNTNAIITCENNHQCCFHFCKFVPPGGNGPLPAVLQYWGNPWDRRSKLHSLSPLTKIEVTSGVHDPIRDITLARTVYFYLILAKRPRSDSSPSKGCCFYTDN